ncbi:MAG: hypothetical protein A4E26_02284 [Methanobacterium sp. PtaU1.Bin097]|jgi:hypothetical protein|nr:MAG: hypothetical protein A4E26_02284 [Methanobacterium sp. PtaU1.Bin097]
MTPRKRPESALGKGLDALIRKDYLDEEEKKPKKSGKKQTKSTGSTKTSVKDKKAETAETDVITQIQESTTPSVDDKIVDAVLLEVHKNPRISLWSAKSAAVLRFLKKTKPEFSISNEASLLIEEAVKDRHPDIWKIFEEKGL